MSWKTADVRPALSVGEARIHRVEEARHRFPFAAFGLEDAQVERHRDWLFPGFVDAERTWEMVFQSWLVVLDGKVVLVDPCVGNGRSFPLPMFDHLQTPYIERFAATGVRPQDVDYVFCTHLHCDHCGWNTELRGGRYVPTFPNARYLMVRREFDRWDTRRPDYDPTTPHNRMSAGIFENSVLPVLEAGLADLTPDRHEIIPGLWIEPAYGHTAGHSCLHLSSAGEHAWFTGDLFAHPIELVHPEIERGLSEDAAANIATRRRLIAEFIARDALIVPAHFAAPHAGWLRERGGVRRFEAYGL